MTRPPVVEVAEELQALVPTFLANRRKDAGQLVHLVAEGDLAAVGRIAHNLKGVGGGYGFHQVSHWGEQLEQLVAQGDLPGLAACVEDLRAFLEVVHVVYVRL